MNFVFRLEKVLTLRRDAVDAAREAVGRAEEELRQAILLVERCRQELKQRHEDLIKNHYQMAEEHLRMIRIINGKLEKAIEDVKVKEKNVEIARARLLEAKKELEALEKLKERQADEFYQEQNRLEQKQTDERATLKFTTEIQRKQAEEAEE